MPSVDQLIRTKRVIICVGPGGVGKTTTSAAIALRAAAMGRRTLVLTVDPARRLANSLGLDGFEHEEQAIEGTTLFAMMLDTRKTFDSIVERYTSDEATRRRILESPFYEQASTRLSGSQEYMAMEKLYELHQADRFDLIVLDTPPTVHALDFLDAPDRLESFMRQSTDGLMAKSTRILGKLGLGFLKANTVILKGISKFLGTQLFLDILEFLHDFQSMYTGFVNRAGAVKRLMHSDEVAFVILTAPTSSSMEEGLFFHARLEDEGLPFGAFVVNRVHQRKTDLSEKTEARLRQELQNDALTDALIAAAASYDTLADRDRRCIEDLRERLGPDATLHVVPDFDEDIHDLDGLNRYGATLTSGS